MSANGTRTTRLWPSILWPDPAPTEALAVSAPPDRTGTTTHGDAQDEDFVTRLTFLTATPTTSTVPTTSSPRIRPSVTAGTSP